MNAVECLEDLRMAEGGSVRARYDGHVRVAFSLAFMHLLHSDSLEEAVVDTVMHGGDADTNGCIVGALMGAQHGFGAIPAQWVEAVKGARVKRPKEYQATDLDTLADCLLCAVRGWPG
jgi:ADP-ribosylglycohydrolase